MISKLGYFILAAYPGEIEAIKATRPRIIKGYAAHPMLADLHATLGDDTVFINRVWLGTDDMLHWFNYTSHVPEEAARAWMDASRSQMQQAPFAYYESFNEMASWPDMALYARFEAERQRIMYEEGFRACIGNFSTGTPPMDTDSDYPNAWRDFFPALEACNRYQNILGLHEYGGLCMDLWYGPNQHGYIVDDHRWDILPDVYSVENWLFGRYRQIWNKFLVPNGWINVRMAITELGLDRAGTWTTDALTGGGNAGPWQQIAAHRWWEKWPFYRDDPEQFYFDQLQWVDYQMRKDEYMVGATIFIWGTNDDVWSKWDVAGGVAQRIGNWLNANRHPDNYRVVTARKNLYVRTKIGRFVKGVLPYNAIVQLLSTEGEWAHIRTATGREGYVIAAYLDSID